MAPHAQDTPPVVVPDWGQLPETTSPLRPDDRVLLVGAHPDDETIGAGRLVADHPGDVTAVTLSAGEHCVDGVDPAEIGPWRLAEWRTALAALGVRGADTRRWPDGALTEHLPQITELLSDLAAAYDVVLTTWRHDPHPDHRAAGLAGAQAAVRTGARLVEFVVWAPYWTSLAEVRGHGFAVRTCRTTAYAQEARERALAAYPSQTAPLPPATAPVVPQALLDRHREQILVVPR